MDPFLTWFATQALGPALVSRGLEHLGKKDWRKRLIHQASVPRFRRGKVRRWLAKPATWDDLVSPSPDAVERLVSTLSSSLRPLLAWRRGRRDPDRLRSEAEQIATSIIEAFLPGLEPSFAVAVAHHREFRVLVDLVSGQEEIRDIIQGENLTERLKRLPPLLRRTIRELTDEKSADAAKIARLLTDVPAGLSKCDRVSELLAHTPSWMEEGDSRLWLILGEFAAAYSCGAGAADAFERAVSSGAADQPRWLARAALAAADSDADRAQRLLTRAREMKPDHRFVALVAAMVSEDLDAILSATGLDDWADDPHVGIAYVARARAQTVRDDFDGAIESCERGLTFAPESSALVFELAQALALRAQEPGARNREADLRACRARAHEAQLMRREWEGDSVEPLALACRAAIAGQDWAAVLELGREPPTGSALPLEASSQLVLPHVAAASAVTGDREYAISLLERITDEFERTFLKGLLAEDDHEALAAFESALDLASSRAQKTEVQLGLAAQGKWPIPGLQETREHDEELADVIEAVAHAKRGELDSAFPLLRKWSATSLRAARLLVDTYEQAGEIEKAVEISVESHGRFGEERFLVEAVTILVRAGQYDEAERQAGQAIEIATTPAARRVLRRAQIDLAAKRGDWSRVEHLAGAAIAEGYDDPSTRWALVGAIFNQLRSEEAWKAFRRMKDLQPTDEHEARLWLELNRRFNQSPEWADAALRLAEQYRESEAFTAAVITALLVPPTGISLAEDTVRRLHELTDSFFERFPDTTFIQRIPAGDIEELVEGLREKLEPGSAQINEIGNKVLKGQVPIGMIAAATGKSYAEAIVQLCGLYLPLESESEETRGEENEAARRAMEKGAVVEATVLYTGSILRQLWPIVRSSFDTLIFPNSSLVDIVQARDSLAMRSTGSLSWNATTGRPIFAEISANEAEARAETAAFMSREALRLKVVPYPRFFHFIDFEEDRFGPWLASLDLAKEHGVALFSDDALLRSLARSVGVPAFGILALLRTLVEQQRLKQDELRSASITLRTRHAVEMPFDIEELLEAARSEEFKPGGVAFAMTRRAFWRNRNEALGIYRQICREALGRDRDLVPHWLYVATLGLSDGASEENVTQMAAGLLGGTCVDFGLDPQMVKELVEASRQGARVRGGEDPLAHAARHLVGILSSNLPADQLAPYVMGLFSQLDPEDRHIVLAVILGESGGNL